jgi:hypothetical protein
MNQIISISRTVSNDLSEARVVKAPTVFLFFFLFFLLFLLFLLFSKIKDIASKTAESDYQSVSVDCRNLMGEINGQLGKLMSQLPRSR